MTQIILDKNGGFTEDFCKWSLYQVAQGLQAMHSKNVLHRDIKSDNILCRPNGDIKVADMGFSVFLSEQDQYRQTQKGTPSWVSPEIAKGVTYSKEVDVWSYGCFAFELATGQPPHRAETQDINVLFNKIINQKVPRIPSKWSDSFADFVDKCFIKNPAERWSFEQLLSHEFLQNPQASRQAWSDEFTQW